MSDYLQDITIKKLIENRKIQEASGKDIIKYPFEGYTIPDDKWDEFAQAIKGDYKLEAIKENDIIYLKGARNNIASFMLTELGIADTGILDYPTDDFEEEPDEEAAKEANSIIDYLKKNMKHPNDTTFQVNKAGTQINMSNKNYGTPSYNLDAYITIEDGYYKLYASWKYDRNGYGYLGFTFREQDKNKFLEKTVKKLDQKFYPEEEPEKPTPKNLGKLNEKDITIVNIINEIYDKYKDTVQIKDIECKTTRNYTDEGYLTKRCSYPSDPYCNFIFFKGKDYYTVGRSAKKDDAQQVLHACESLLKDLQDKLNIKCNKISNPDKQEYDNYIKYVFEATADMPVSISFSFVTYKTSREYKYGWEFVVKIFRSSNIK